MRQLPRPAAEPALVGLAGEEEVDDAGLAGLVELAAEEGKRVEDPVEDPGAGGIERGVALRERMLDQAGEPAEVGAFLEEGGGGGG